eukprot:4152067-Alexandrium_andersonii.AAC.1
MSGGIASASFPRTACIAVFARSWPILRSGVVARGAAWRVACSVCACVARVARATCVACCVRRAVW